VMDLRLNTLTRTREFGGGYYLNATVPQGHTERGQLLGADITAGSGSGATIAIDGYSRTGRWTVSWTRTLIDTLGVYFETGTPSMRSPEAQHALGFEVLRFYGPVDIRAGLTGVYDINRYFTHDAFDLNAILGARWSW
jgi:hypothetical protein